MKEAKEILNRMYLEENFNERKNGKMYAEFSKSELILFCMRLLDTIETDTEE